ncbi:MAG TPA: phytanoyl-CoA dioxygenase family protein [Fimbriimonadaceae bacterium]|nr:phytanoyl-CoA dioxygenase family protein [Fimbriimonadaceae bacterium]
MALASTELKTDFQRDGYVVVRGLFSGPILADMQRDFDRIVDQLVASGEDLNARWLGAEGIGPADSVVLHTHNVQQYSAVWLRAVLHEPFLDAARALLGEDIVLHHTKLFVKPPEKGAPFPMHQDWDYFPTEKDTMLAGIVHLTEATDEMGCLRVVPGSHKLGRIEASHGNAKEFVEEHRLEDAVPIEAQPGDVVFFHYFTIHGSMPNTSDKVRKTVLIQMHSGDDRVEEGNLHPDESLAISGFNRRMTRERANRAE